MRIRAVSNVYMQDILKNNKRLKGTDKTLLALRRTFERVRTCWSASKGVWLAIDFEAWEMEHQLITEYGWSLVRWQGEEEMTQNGHYIVEEHQKYKNTTYVGSNREVCPYAAAIGILSAHPAPVLSLWREQDNQAEGIETVHSKPDFNVFQ